MIGHSLGRMESRIKEVCATFHLQAERAMPTGSSTTSNPAFGTARILVNSPGDDARRARSDTGPVTWALPFEEEKAKAGHGVGGVGGVNPRAVKNVPPVKPWYACHWTVLAKIVCVITSATVAVVLTIAVPFEAREDNLTELYGRGFITSTSTTTTITTDVDMRQLSLNKQIATRLFGLFFAVNFCALLVLVVAERTAILPSDNFYSLTTFPFI